jgi:hypothetical protein
VPIPDRPPGEVTTGAAVVALFLQLHDELRGLVGGLDHRGLNYVPCQGANSVATITTHLLGSEAETLRAVAGLQPSRDRDAEFQAGEQTAAELLTQLSAADELLHELGPALTTERLLTTTSLPTLPPREARPGVTWLIGNLGHAREHVGHAFLTKQLYEVRSRPSS